MKVRLEILYFQIFLSGKELLDTCCQNENLTKKQIFFLKVVRPSFYLEKQGCPKLNWKTVSVTFFQRPQNKVKKTIGSVSKIFKYYLFDLLFSAIIVVPFLKKEKQAIMKLNNLNKIYLGNFIS